MHLRHRTKAKLVAVVVATVVVAGMATAFARKVELGPVFAAVNAAHATSVAQIEAR